MVYYAFTLEGLSEGTLVFLSAVFCVRAIGQQAHFVSLSMIQLPVVGALTSKVKAFLSLEFLHREINSVIKVG